jgi:hypothetical protein
MCTLSTLLFFWLNMTVVDLVVVPNSMKQSPSVNQVILHLLWNPTICYYVHKSLPLVPVLNQMNPVPFQRIHPNPRPCVVFHTMLPFIVRVCYPCVQPSNWRITPSQLSTTVYSYSQLLFIFENYLLHLQFENVPCCSDEEPS